MNLLSLLLMVHLIQMIRWRSSGPVDLLSLLCPLLLAKLIRESVESVVDGPLDPDEADDPCDGAQNQLYQRNFALYAPNLIVGLLGESCGRRANLKVTMHNLLCGSWDGFPGCVPSFWSQDAIDVIGCTTTCSESVDVVLYQTREVSINTFSLFQYSVSIKSSSASESLDRSY